MARKTQIDRDLISREFIRAGGEPNDAALFARQVESLATEIPEPAYGVKERRRLTKQAATALRNAADALSKLDGVSAKAMVCAAADHRRRFEMRTNPHTFGSEAYVAHIHDEQRRMADDPTLRNHPPIGRGHFAFGRHGLPEKPARHRPSQDRSRASLAGMLADLELLAIAATRATRTGLDHTVGSIDLLALRLVDTMAAFNVRATGSAQGLADVCMRAVLDARKNSAPAKKAASKRQPSGLDAVRKAIRRRLSETRE